MPYPLPSPAGLARALRRLVPAADVVHVHDVLYVLSVAALLAARRSRRPALLTLHVGFVPQANRALDVAELGALRAVTPVARLAARASSYNEDVARWGVEALGLPEVEVLPVGVSQPPAAAARTELRLAEDRFVALFVGRDVPKKGLGLVFAAAGPEYDLVAVTDSRRAAPAGVRILPFMPPERLGALLGAVDAFVLPSRAEGVPLALQEAMVAGLPVVTTMQPGYWRWFTSDDVLAVEPSAAAVREALIALAGDPGLRRRLGERARAVGAAQFSEEAFVDAYERVLAEVSSGST